MTESKTKKKTAKRPARSQTRQAESYYDDVAFTLSEARIINLYGPINGEAMQYVSNSLEYMSRKNLGKPIEIFVNSPGGVVIDGLAIYDKIVQINKTTPVNITVNGACMSMATIILQAGRERRAYKNSEFLLHEIQYGVRGSHSEQKDYMQQAQRLQARLNEILSERSGMSLEKLQSLIERRDYTISAEEALNHGLIDKIIQ